MTITAGIVLFGMIWFVVFLALLPLHLKTQGEAGEIVPGTHSSAPVDPKVGRKALIATLVAAVIWAIVAVIIIGGVIRVQDFDWFNRMRPAVMR
ncbi:MAG: DUF1467 family protein [Rubellimicrobium sp.]|nr:DUF1467 family protein [Rubellimicrobium sp.]